MKINKCRCGGHFGTDMSIRHTAYGSEYQVYCTDCGIESGMYSTKDEAIEDWNNNMSARPKYHAYIGRWQSPHLGHKWLIDQNLKAGKPVLILIRDVEVNENNPFTAQEVEQMLRTAFFDECMRGEVAIQIIPDIHSINYGRGVGYEVNCLESQCPPEIKRISATEIRRQIRAGEDGWKSMVMLGVEEKLEEKFKCQ